MAQSYAEDAQWTDTKSNVSEMDPNWEENLESQAKSTCLRRVLKKLEDMPVSHWVKQSGQGCVG